MLKKDGWYRGALLSALSFGGLALLATPSAAQEGCPDPCFYDEIEVTDTVPDEEVVGNPVEPGSDSGYENLGGMGPDASPSSEEVGRELSRTIRATEVMDTDDRCAWNIDDNDAVGVNHGGTNTHRPKHSGVDIQGNPRDPVYAVMGGTIKYAEHPRVVAACGDNTIDVRSAGYIFRYCHMASRSVPNGSWVSAGDPLGGVGMEGNAGGFHLHLSVWRPGQGGSDDPRIPFYELTEGGKDGLTFVSRDKGGC